MGLVSLEVDPADHPPSVFWRYWTGSTISRLGDAVTSVGLPLTAVTVVHATAFEVSLVAAAGYAAWVVLGLPAGVLVSRLPLRATQIAMDLVRAAAVAAIPVLAWWGRLGVAELVLVALVMNAATVVFDVGNSTMLPSIVTKAQLTARNSLTSASDGFTQLGGPSLGGALVQLFGAAPCLLVDAASYIVSATLLRSLPRPRHLAANPSNVRISQAVAEGWRFVTRHPVMRPCVAFATAINFVCGAVMALAPVYLIRTLHAPPVVVGVLLASEGVGSFLGAVATPHLARGWGSARVVIAVATVIPGVVALMPSAEPRWGLVLFAAGNAGLGACVVVGSILTRVHRQTVTPVDLLPRVMATVRFISWGAIPVGALAAGGVATWLGPRGAFIAIAVASLAAPVTLWLSDLRHHARLEDAARHDALARVP